jgi:hypothetical protein
MPNPFKDPRLSYYDQDCLIFSFTGKIHIFIHDPRECEREYGTGQTLPIMTDHLIDLFFGGQTTSHLQASVVRCLSLIILFDRDFPCRESILGFLERVNTPEEKKHLCSYVEDHLSIMRRLIHS